MTKRSIAAPGVLAAVACAAALGGAGQASAQGYGYGQPYYDPCRRDTNNRTIAGALLGGAGGAVVGSQFAATGHRRDGSALGGVLGAIAGGMVGNKTAACEPGAPRAAMAPPPVAPPPVAYRGGYYEDDMYTRGHGYYGRAEPPFRVIDRPPAADGCTLAESPIYLPDGRVQKRFVRVCQDSSGRYQVVD